jgi:hypothetical protein
MDFELRKTLLEGLKLLLRPVAKFCLRRSIKIQDGIEMLKHAFIEVAREELERTGRLVSNSRLSVMTGLHRRDVVRLLLEGVVVTENAPLLLRVIGQWQESSELRLKSGEPRPLTFEGKNSEFVELVRSISKDLNPYTVLFELERVGAVVREESRLRLVTDVYVPSGNLKEGLGLLGRDVEDLLLAVEDNLFRSPSIPHLHIKTHYDNVILSAIPELRSWCLEQGAEFHARIRKKLAKYDKDLNPRLKSEEGGGVVAVGTFSRIYHRVNHYSGVDQKRST